MKNLRAIFVIAVVFVLLILITAIIASKTQGATERSMQGNDGIVQALKSGVADRVSAYFSSDVNFFALDNPTSTDSLSASHVLQTFFKAHPVQDFEIESRLPGNTANLSYLKGILHTTDQDYMLYATIYKGKAEKFDLNAVDP